MRHSETGGHSLREPRAFLQTIGNTPLVTLERLPAEGSAAVLGKLESLNPTGSVKDRIALAMVLDAEESGRLGPGQTLVEGDQRQLRHRTGNGWRRQGLPRRHRDA